MGSLNRHERDGEISLPVMTGGGLSAIAFAIAISGGQEEPQSLHTVVPTEVSKAPQVEPIQKTRLEASAIIEGKAKPLIPTSVGNKVWHGLRALSEVDFKAMETTPDSKVEAKKEIEP